MADYREVRERYLKNGQARAFRVVDLFAGPERDRLVAELDAIDLDALKKMTTEAGAEPEALDPSAMESANVRRLPTSGDEYAEFERARKVGEDALRAGRVAAFLVAGGQGSRLGFDGPKGAFPVGLVPGGRTLFQFHAEKIANLRTRYKSDIPWFIMTADTNHADTVDFFQRHGFFGLPEKDVFFFRQAMVPAVDRDGNVILTAGPCVFKNPNGHGGALAALRDSGALSEMQRRGIDRIFYFQVDNLMINICDPVFLGFHELAQSQMSSKVLKKTGPDEKVGNLLVYKGRERVIEYSDFPDEVARLRDEKGELKFLFGSIAIHVFDRAFVETLTAGGLRLPWHRAEKNIPFLGDDGKPVEPKTPNGIKFETFVFDALPLAERTMAMECERVKEFAPIKNAAGVDSAESARRMLRNLWKDWFVRAGVAVPLDRNGEIAVDIEISPRFAFRYPEFAEKISGHVSFKNPTVIE